MFRAVQDARDTSVRSRPRRERNDDGDGGEEANRQGDSKRGRHGTSSPARGCAPSTLMSQAARRTAGGVRKAGSAYHVRSAWPASGRRHCARKPDVAASVRQRMSRLALGHDAYSRWFRVWSGPLCRGEAGDRCGVRRRHAGSASGGGPRAPDQVPASRAHSIQIGRVHGGLVQRSGLRPEVQAGTRSPFWRDQC